MALFNKIFLHFFDVHYLDEKGVKHIPNKIYKEASLATRFALLSADEIFIPASSYFESPICNKIIDQYFELIPYGFIWLIGNAFGFKEFCEGKLFQYSNRPEFKTIYESKLENNVKFPFHKRERSSTKDIVTKWTNTLYSSEVSILFDDCTNFTLPSNFEDKWHDVPVLLKNNAFIVQNVAPLLFPSNHYNLSVLNKLHSIINQAYFHSYVNELGASIVSDMVVLDSNYYITEARKSIPYKYVLREIALRSKLEYICNMFPEQLVSFRESEEWADILNSAFNKKLQSVRTMDYFYNKDDRMENKGVQKESPTFMYVKELQMTGDMYSVGQVAALGPNAHAHDNTFNQIWKQSENEIDLHNLSKELELLREELKSEAKTAQDFSEIGSVANAEIESKKGNGSKALEYLAKTSKWTYGIAEKIGVGVAAAAIKAALGV